MHSTGAWRFVVAVVAVVGLPRLCRREMYVHFHVNSGMPGHRFKFLGTMFGVFLLSGKQQLNNLTPTIMHPVTWDQDAKLGFTFETRSLGPSPRIHGRRNAESM